MGQQPPNFPPGPPNFAGPPDSPPEPPPNPKPLANGDDGSPAYLRVMRHPIVLAGSGIVIVMLIIAIVLVVVGSDDNDEDGKTGESNRPTVEVTQTPAELRGLLGTTLSSATVRSGPGEQYAVLGVLQRGTEVDVVGRSEDGDWLQAYYPPGSQLHGWIEAALLEVEGDPLTLVLGEANAGPSVEVPTAPFIPEEPLDDEPTEGPEATEPLATEPFTDTPPPLPTDTPPLLPTDTPPPTVAPPLGP